MEPTKEEFEKLVSEGYSRSKMAKHFGLTDPQIRRRLKKFGITLSISKIGQKEFLQKCKDAHGDKYDYSKSVYTGSKEKVIIVCPVHGEFEQTAQDHWAGKGCSECAIDKTRDSKESFLKKARRKHGDKYDYSETQYISLNKNIKFSCPHHGEIEQLAINHISGIGCHKCKEKEYEERFFREVSEVHGDSLDFSDSVYVSRTADITVRCPKHGYFVNQAYLVAGGQGCRKCRHEEMASNTEEFKEKSDKIHKDVLGRNYSYEKFEYKNHKTPGIVTCKEHGDFVVKPRDHLYNWSGCPGCGSVMSRGHQKISKLLEDLGIEHINNDRKEIHPLELDVWVPSHKFAIEVNGTRFHGVHIDNLEKRDELEKYHKKKYDICKENDIDLYQFWDVDINSDQKFKVISSMITHKLKKSNRVFARKCEIKRVPSSYVRKFMDVSHIQGHRDASFNYVLEKDGKIQCCLSFSKHPVHQWEIMRYACDLNTTVVGGFSRLLKSFIKDENPEEIVTFADALTSHGSVYENNGFKYIHTSAPGYFYSKHNKKLSRQACQKKNLPNVLGDRYNPDLTEETNMLVNGWVKVYGAGNHKFLWKP